MSSESLIATLRSRGMRITAPRRAICEVIAATHADHLTAAGILEAAWARSDAKIDPSTVYRTLDALEEAGTLSHSHLGHGASVYHLADEAAHQHLICSSCGRTFELPERDVRAFFDGITAHTGFVADPTHFAVSGLCAECAGDQVP